MSVTLVFFFILNKNYYCSFSFLDMCGENRISKFVSMSSIFLG